MINPVQLELPDLVALKNQTHLGGLIGYKDTWIGFGDNKSVFKSRGLNFQEIRQYQPGDDIRQIDWRVTAKYGKPYTKLYAEEKEKEVYILCDLRPTMHFASHGHFKSVMAGRLAALIGFLADKKNDAMAYQILTNQLLQSLGVLPAHDILPHFLNQLCLNETTGSEVSFKQAIPFIEQNIRPGSLIFFISDFHDISHDHLTFIGELSHKNTVTCLHLYDKMEIELPKGIFPFSNGHKEILIDTDIKSFQQEFKESWNQRTLSLRQAAQKYQLGYLPLATDSNYLREFQHFCFGDIV